MTAADEPGNDGAAKQELIRILEKLLNCDRDLDFLMQLETRPLEQLIVAVRGIIEKYAAK